MFIVPSETNVGAVWLFNAGPSTDEMVEKSLSMPLTIE